MNEIEPRSLKVTITQATYESKNRSWIVALQWFSEKYEKNEKTSVYVVADDAVAFIAKLEPLIFFFFMLEFMIVDDCQRFPVIKSKWQKYGTKTSGEKWKGNKKSPQIRKYKSKFQRIYLHMQVILCVSVWAWVNRCFERARERYQSKWFKPHKKITSTIIWYSCWMKARWGKKPNLM